MKDKIKFLIGRKINKIFLILFPPYGYKSTDIVDISFGLILNESKKSMIIIDTDINDGTTPIIDYKKAPKEFYNYNMLKDRINYWRTCPEDDVIQEEFFEISNSPEFEHILHQTVLKIELIRMDKSFLVGLKIIFEKDNITSISTGIGNTIETKFFNKNYYLEYLSSVSEIDFLECHEQLK